MSFAGIVRDEQGSMIDENWLLQVGRTCSDWSVNVTPRAAYDEFLTTTSADSGVSMT
jgi:hypothetical protein